MSIKKKILITLSVGILIVIAVALYMFNKPARDVQDTKTDFSYNASEIVNEYLNDARKANDKYLDEQGNSKVLEITGTVAQIAEDFDNQKVILLKSATDKAGVSATFPKETNSQLETIINTLEEANIKLPFIIKPDMGLQGLRVEKIPTWNELTTYLQKTDYDFLVQEYISYSLEIGLFYYRMPNEKKGTITGIVYKDFLIVIGNGTNTIQQLIEQNPRFALQLNTLKQKFGEKLNEVLPSNEVLNLVPFGNHVRGSKFTDVSHWINEKLTETFNDICLQIPDFYFGRLDIMFKSREDLEQGKNFSIIELNGAGSEPTHMYDPKHSIFFAWKEIIKHYNILYKISTFNHQKGHSYLNMKQSRQLVIDNKKLTNHLKSIS